MALMSANGRPLESNSNSGFGIRSNIQANPGSNAQSIRSRSPTHDFAWIQTKKVVDPTPAPVAASSMSALSSSQQLFLMPLIVLVASPYVAPVSQKIIDTLAKMSNKFLTVFFEFLSSVGTMYKIASQKFYKVCQDLFALIQKSSSYASEQIVEALKVILVQLKDISIYVGDQMNAICKEFSSMCIVVSINTGKLAKSTASSFSAAAIAAKDGVYNGAKNVSASISPTVVATRDAFYVGAKKSSSFVSSAAKATARELTLISELTASSIAQGTVATSNFLMATCKSIGEACLSSWEMTSTAVSIVCESVWNNAVSATLSTASFMKKHSIFLATEFVNVVETAAWGMATAPKVVYNGIMWIKNTVPSWLNNVAKRLNLIEKVEDEVVLTTAAQAIMYVTSAVSAINPYLRGAPPLTRATTVGEAVTTAVENVRYRWCPPRTLFLTGALARGMHLSSSLAYTFHPTYGLLALINAGAIVSKERWIACIVAGWATTPSIWKLFGAKPPKKEEGEQTGEKGKKKGWMQ